MSGVGNATPGAAAAVCDGGTFEPSNGERTKVAVFTDGGEGFEYTPYSGELPMRFEATIPEEADAIVCMNVTSSRIVERCRFTDDDTGRTFIELLADASYDVRVLASQTGEELASAKMRASAEDCDAITAPAPGNGPRTEYAKPAAQLTDLLRPIVTVKG